MKTFMTFIFLISSLTINAQVSYPDHYAGDDCTGMLYLDIVPAHPKRCSKIISSMRVKPMYCCNEGDVGGVHYAGVYHYSDGRTVPPSTPRTSPPRAVICEEEVVCRQVDVYRHACGIETVCSKE